MTRDHAPLLLILAPLLVLASFAASGRITEGASFIQAPSQQQVREFKHYKLASELVELADLRSFGAGLLDARQNGRAVYLMYITREGFYTRPVRTLAQNAPAVHEIRVDGGVVLRIVQLATGAQ